MAFALGLNVTQNCLRSQASGWGAKLTGHLTRALTLPGHAADQHLINARLVLVDRAGIQYTLNDMHSLIGHDTGS